MVFHLVELPLSWLLPVFLETEGIDPVALAGHTVLLALAVGPAVASSRLVGSRQVGKGMVVGRPGGLGLAGTLGYCTSALLEDGSVEDIGCSVIRQPVVIVSGMIEPHVPGQLLGQRGLGPGQRSVAGQAGLVQLVHVACLEPQPAVAAGFQGLGIGWKNWSSGSWVVQTVQCTSVG